MSVTLAKLTRRRYLAAKIETTTGTAESLAAADCAFNAFNHSLKEISPSNQRDGQGSLSPLTPVAGEQSGEFTFITELYADGTAEVPPDLLILFKAAGFSASGAVLTPVTPQAGTATMGLFNDGRFRSICGASADATLKFVDGKVPQIEWKATGVWVDPVDAALPTGVALPTALPFVFKGATFTVGGTAYKIPELEIALNNTVTLRKDATKATGFFASQITGRRITIKFPAEALALATKNWSTDRKANTTYALSLALGTGAGHICTIAAPVLVQTDPPNDKDANGILNDDLSFVAARNSAAGDDELSITWS